MPSYDVNNTTHRRIALQAPEGPQLVKAGTSTLLHGLYPIPPEQLEHMATRGIFATLVDAAEAPQNIAHTAPSPAGEGEGAKKEEAPPTPAPTAPTAPSAPQAPEPAPAAPVGEGIAPWQRGL